jgi:hypothetical protein
MMAQSLTQIKNMKKRVKHDGPRAGRKAKILVDEV